MTALAASTAAEARRLAVGQQIDLAIVDLLLPDGDGMSVAFELLRLWPRLRVVVMTGGELSADEIAICERQEFPVLRKPFLARDLISLVRASLLRVQHRRPINRRDEASRLFQLRWPPIGSRSQTERSRLDRDSRAFLI